MSKPKYHNIHKYLAFLQDIYKGAKADKALCSKHKLANGSQTSCRKLKFVNKDYFSNMSIEPTIKMARLLMDTNYDYQKKYHIKCNDKAKTNQIQMKLPVKKEGTKAIPKQPVKPATKEINILWGAIKITL